MTRNKQPAPEGPLPQSPAAGAPFSDDRGLNAYQSGCLGAQLRVMFQQIVAEPLPDRFQRLLNELARKDRTGNE